MDYGSPENNFSRISELWTAYLRVPVSALDVAMMMILLKIARVKGAAGVPTDDCFVDLAGYAACGCQIAEGMKNARAYVNKAIEPEKRDRGMV